VNQFVVLASVAECEAIRYTPAGIPILELRLEHESEVLEAKRPRRIQLSLPALVVGELALELNGKILGKHCRFEGFIAPSRKGSSRLRLHVQKVTPVAAEQSPRLTD